MKTLIFFKGIMLIAAAKSLSGTGSVIMFNTILIVVVSIGSILILKHVTLLITFALPPHWRSIPITDFYLGKRT